MDFGTELDEQNNTKHVDSFILAMSRTVGCKLKRDSFSCDITLIVLDTTAIVSHMILDG